MPGPGPSRTTSTANTGSRPSRFPPCRESTTQGAPSTWDLREDSLPSLRIGFLVMPGAFDEKMDKGAVPAGANHAALPSGGPRRFHQRGPLLQAPEAHEEALRSSSVAFHGTGPPLPGGLDGASEGRGPVSKPSGGSNRGSTTGSLPARLPRPRSAPRPSPSTIATALRSTDSILGYASVDEEHTHLGLARLRATFEKVTKQTRPQGSEWTLGAGPQQGNHR